MAHAKRPSHHQRSHSSSISSPSINRRHTLRRVASRIAAHASSDTISSSLHQDRPVLVPVHTNLRRLPSRIVSQSHKNKESNLPMREAGHVIAGSKRKRVASSNENAHNHGRGTRGSGRLKRLRTAATYAQSSEESQSDESEMEIDPPALHAPPSDGSEPEEQSNDSEEENSEAGSDENDSESFLLHQADERRLRRERKSSLIHLYQLLDLPDDAEHMNKSEIIDAIISSRDDDETASGPPSSPPGKTDAASSDESSDDDGNVAGGEETDFTGLTLTPNANALKRRVTMNHLAKTPLRPSKPSRSLSMGNLLGHGEPSVPLMTKRKVSTHTDIFTSNSIPARKRTSSRSSPSTSTAATATQSPPVTRLRSRKVSSTNPPAPSAPISDGSNKGKGKGKAKQVEFSNDVEVHLQSPSRKSSKGKEARQLINSESDLTELEELEKSLRTQPSPRRLRSKDRPKPVETEDNDATPIANSKRHKSRSAEEDNADEEAEDSKQPTRVTPMRKAKKKIGNLRESDEDEEDEEEEEEEEGAENDDEQDEDEVDELVSSASATPPPDTPGRTPLRRRLRPRRDRNKAVPTGEEENEGDDEEEHEIVHEEVEDEDQEVDDDEDQDQEGDEDDDQEGDDDQEEEEGEGEEMEEEGEEVADVAEEEEDEATVSVEPRKLRNGKIVGEEESGMDVDEESIGDEDEDDDAEEDEEEMEDAEGVEEAEDEPIEIDSQSEAGHDEAMEEEVDLTVATAKTLIRLRRDDLVRLCETRDLDPSGTKPQLAEALLQWRDQQANDMSSPSSGGTVRPSSNRRKRRGKQHSSSTDATVPVLLRSKQVHTDEPRTPVPGKEKDSEELELDLESLGLEDREIPPEKLVKQEKIGSGGFKDVFIGKFRGRKIAISEFRGQLSAMDIKELKLLGAFNHPNIVRFLGVSIPENTKETPVMIVSELCSNGDLFDYIRNVNPPAFRKILQMMLDVARGLEYLHTRKPSIIHRDCKSSNILITAKGTAKIADFGLAKVKQSTRSMVRSLVGTVNWQAPELWHAHPKYNHKVDVFSCAMVFWEMLQWHLPTKKFPWEGMNEHAIYEIVGAKRQRPSVSGLKKQWCPEIVALIERMWAHEHQDRPTMSEVVQSLEDLISQY